MICSVSHPICNTSDATFNPCPNTVSTGYYNRLSFVCLYVCVCSGHCIIYVTAPLVFQTYYPGWTAAFLWMAVIRTCFRVRMHKLQYAGQ